MNDGWIKLHRSLIEKAVWKSATSGQKVVMITMLLLANHKPAEWEWKGKKFTCKPGQFITSLPRLSKASGESIQTVRSAINRLIKYDFSTGKSTGHGRLITICNWDEYQDRKNTTQQPTQQTANRRPTPNKNDKNNKKEKITSKKGTFEGKKNSGEYQKDSDEGEFYTTAKKRKLSGRSLKEFVSFWDAFAYKKGRAEAADVWIDIKPSGKLLKDILAGAKLTAAGRSELIKKGQTPKMGQGWLSGRRWEDVVSSSDNKSCKQCDYAIRKTCPKVGVVCDGFKEVTG